MKTIFKKLEYRFLIDSTKFENAYFHTKLPYQKLMLRQIEWWLQSGPITKNGVSPVTNLFSWKFCFNLRTIYKELIWCTNNPNARNCTFCKRWSFIWRYFFLVSILKKKHVLKPYQTTFIIKFIANQKARHLDLSDNDSAIDLSDNDSAIVL